jgi:hypothetical protein
MGDLSARNCTNDDQLRPIQARKTTNDCSSFDPLLLAVEYRRSLRRQRVAGVRAAARTRGPG